jgi:Tol biopolymer transport system component
MLRGTDLIDNVANSTLSNIPQWYSEGLVSYLSRQWDIDTENRVKDGILNGKYRKFNRLTGNDAIYAGHSFWKYIADTYGESVIPSIVYLTSIGKSMKIGFSNVLGFSLKDLTRDWNEYYLNLFGAEPNNPAEPETGRIGKKSKKNVVFEKIRVSPTGNYLTYVTNDRGLYKIWLVNIKTGKKKKIFKREYRLDQITDYSFPVITWHPSARYIAFMTEEKGGLKLYYYNIAEKKLTVRNFLYFDKVLDFSFSKEGSSFVFSGTRNGRTDIYVHDLASSTNRQITNDIFDDLQPRFIENDNKIIFSSNRISDTLSSQSRDNERSLSTDLFIYDFKNGSDQLMRLNDQPYTNKYAPQEVDHNTFIQLSDQTGILNRYISKFDSTVSAVDTAIHYRYYAETAPLTQYSRNILEQDYQESSGTVAEIIYNKGRYHIFHNPLNETESLQEKPQITSSHRKRLKILAAKDSVRSIKKEVIPIADLASNKLVVEDDTIDLGNEIIDVNKYVFEIEKINTYNEKLVSKKLELAVDTIEKGRPKIRFYRPVFYQSSLVTQVDFNFLNASYQPYTRGAYYFNPGFNVLLKIGAYDLFEDYKIIGGVRISPDLDANEYLLSFENLKRRLDKQLIFHREAFRDQGIDDIGQFDIKTHSHQLSLILRYPFTQVKSIAATVSYRNDQTVYLPTYDDRYLDKPNKYGHWVGLKFEYVFDNTRSMGVNLYAGTRYKIFAEAQEQVYKNFYELVVFGADIRNYLPIHRSLIWANRFAWSSSQGSSRIIYYLGGVDNWINLSGRTKTFLPFTETPVDETQNYAFQAVGTNMRGFSQNIRNGNNFAVFNSEIRFPVFKYLANHPLSKSFFENFQIVGFFDLGSAWSGPTPWSSKNAYDNDIVQQGPITITIDANRPPIVAGYGVGIHTQLLGYFVRFDWAWGIDNNEIRPYVFYFSTSLDF